jgi:mannosyl-oligosaccharide glucosidase
MAVTDFISRLKARKSGPSGLDLGMDVGMGGSQVPFSDSSMFISGSRYLESDEFALSYLKSIYGPLKRHYDWFRRTQRGQIKQYSRKSRSRTEAYRWRGRSQMHVLTSGMDDYPRGPPHAGELHLDLMSWMGFFTRTMREIADFVGETEDEANFRDIENAIVDNIDGEHCLRLAGGLSVDRLNTQICIGVKRSKCTAMRVSMMMVCVIPHRHVAWLTVLFQTNHTTSAIKATYPYFP